MPHGFIIWDLHNKQLSTYHVKNDYATILVKKNYQNQIFYVRHQRKWMPLDEIVNNSWFPSKLMVRVTSQDTNDILVLDEIRQILSKYNISVINSIHQIMKESDHDSDDVDNNNMENIIDISSFNTPQAWMDFVSNTNTPKYQHWKNWFEDFTTLKIPSCKGINLSNKLDLDIIKRNKKIEDDVSKVSKNIESTFIKRHPFTINHMEWENILCYKGTNYFDFDTFDIATPHAKNILSIVAPNGCGKTSFLETICIALYGQDFPSRSNSSYSASIIHNNKNEKDHAQTIIHVSINNIKYRIRRTFTYINQEKTCLKSQVSETTIHVYDPLSQEYQLIHSGSTMVKSWVNENIGEFDAFLTSCMISQNGDKDFFNNSSVQQRDLLDNALHIESTNDFLALIKESKLAHNAILETSKTILSTLTTSSDNIDPLDIQHEINIKKKYIEELECEKQNIIHTYTSLNKQIHGIQDFHQTFQFGKDKLLAEIKRCKNILDNEVDEINEDLDTNGVRSDITQIHKEIALLGNLLHHNTKTSQQATEELCLLQSHLQNLSHPKYTLDDVTAKEHSFREIIMKFNLEFPGKDHTKISNIVDVYKKNLKTQNTLLKTNNNSLQEIQVLINDNNDSLIKLRNSRPLHPRSTNEEYEEWLHDIQQFKNNYGDLASIQARYDECIVDTLPRPSIDFLEVSEKYNAKNIQSSEIDAIDIDQINNKIQLLNDTCNLFNNDLEK